MKIRSRLFILLLGLTLVPIVVLGTGAYLIAGGAIEGKVADQLYKVRSELTQSGSNVIGSMNRTLDEMEDDRNFQLCLHYASTRDVSLLRDIVDKTFQYHISRDDRILGVVAEIPGAEAIRIARPGVVLPAADGAAGAHAMEGGVFRITREIARTGATGKIHLFFSQDAFLPMLRDADIGAGKPVAGFLIADGRMLTPYPDANQSLLQSDLDRPGLITYNDRVAVAGKIEGTGFIVGASLSDAAFRAPLSRVRDLSILLILAGFAAAGAAALVFATTLVRPIQSMVELTRRVADGDLDVSLTAERSDELGELAADFNLMTGRLKESEARVEERTRALVQEQARVGLALRMCRNVLLQRGFESEVQAVCEEIRKHFGFSRVSVYLVSEEGTRIDGAAAAGTGAANVRGQEFAVEDLPGPEIHRAISRAAAGGKTQVWRSRDASADEKAASTGEAMIVRDYACVPLRARGRTFGIIVVTMFIEEVGLGADTVATLEAFADIVSLAILEAKMGGEMREAYLDVLAALAEIIDSRDAYTGMHTENVLAYSTALARAANISEKEIEGVRIGAILHDIGKVAVVDAILQKPGALTKEEFEEMKRHPAVGSAILSGHQYLRAAADVVKHHHERWDGKGYPEGLKGDKIPVAAQVVGIADAYDAMITDRPYRTGLGPVEAMRRLKEAAGTQFNPWLVDLFIKTLGLEESETAYEIAEKKDGAVLRLSVTGVLTLDAGRKIHIAISEWIGKHTEAEIDLMRTTRLTDAGIWSLMRVSSKCRSMGGQMRLYAAGLARQQILTASEGIPIRVMEDR